MRQGREAWAQVPIPPALLKKLEPGTRSYIRKVEDGFLRLFVSPSSKVSPAWHASISHVSKVLGLDGQPIFTRLPSWEEVVEARYIFIPDEANMTLAIPRKSDAETGASRTFHLIEVKQGA
jgi:hypothetical protein